MHKCYAERHGENDCISRLLRHVPMLPAKLLVASGLQERPSALTLPALLSRALRALRHQLEALQSASQRCHRRDLGASKPLAALPLQRPSANCPGLGEFQLRDAWSSRRCIASVPPSTQTQLQAVRPELRHTREVRETVLNLSQSILQRRVLTSQENPILMECKPLYTSLSSDIFKA